MKPKKLQAAIANDRAEAASVDALLCEWGFGDAVVADKRNALSAGLNVSAIPNGFKAANRGSPDAIAQSLGYLSAEEIHGGAALVAEIEENGEARSYFDNNPFGWDRR